MINIKEIEKELAEKPQLAYQHYLEVADQAIADKEKAGLLLAAVNAAIQYAPVADLPSLTDHLLREVKNIAETADDKGIWAGYHCGLAHIFSLQANYTEAVAEGQLYRSYVEDISGRLSITKLMLVNAAKSGNQDLVARVFEDFNAQLENPEVSREVYIYALDGKAMALSDVNRLDEAREALIKAWETYEQEKDNPEVRPIRHGGLTRTGLGIVLKHHIDKNDPAWHFVAERIPTSLEICKKHGFKRYFDQIAEMKTQWLG